MEVTESLKNSLEALNNLSAGHLAHKIFTYGLPPVGWCLDVYMRNGEIYFSDYYTGGTVIEYGPDEVLTATLDNTHGDLEPDENYTVGDTWELPEEIIEKYRDRFPQRFAQGRTTIPHLDRMHGPFRERRRIPVHG